MEEKIKKLAQNLLQNSVDLQPGEKLYIDNRSTSSLPLVEALIETACQMGGVPLYISGFKGNVLIIQQPSKLLYTPSFKNS